jgi:hypothetical protein
VIMAPPLHLFLSFFLLLGSYSFGFHLLLPPAAGLVSLVSREPHLA